MFDRRMATGALQPNRAKNAVYPIRRFSAFSSNVTTITSGMRNPRKTVASTSCARRIPAALPARLQPGKTTGRSIEKGE
jgi:hypothetical protein